MSRYNCWEQGMAHRHLWSGIFDCRSRPCFFSILPTPMGRAPTLRRSGEYWTDALGCGSGPRTAAQQGAITAAFSHLTTAPAVSAAAGLVETP